ncbi:BZ3500_MvSof-1268-A1-R1_Chr9g10793 [Microbotryum saponariae]|uniref:BZ3500_MvSof-1268-A1-R1_Chr9g10793 protein n=1 Tax=Microbotryum saponariae TaxID=289078 RepID=A0A2X0KFF2_9BASI|nr:BZ3501_MvSof-1269-A2-R1_Chr9g10541 [Microbotryum saponariae]SDA00703.1 BZ3500_MvSof-1268-A1-R1_Chr9g10793 [Microbotryum saponariae]
MAISGGSEVKRSKKVQLYNYDRIRLSNTYITEVEIIPAECCPPIVLVRSRPEASTLLSTLCPRLSLTDASPLRQMWILWKLLAPEESGNVREVAVTKRLLQNAATLPSHILDHIALHVESRRFVANDRGAFLPSDSPRVDVAFVTILVPPCHKDRRYRSLIDKKHPPTIRHLVTAFSRLTQVVFAFSDCGIKLRGIAPSNVLHVDGEVLVWDLANATFSEYPRSSARLPTDPEEMCGQGLRNSKTFRASVYTDLKSSIITFVATIARAFEECTDEETRQVWRPFGFGKAFGEIDSTPLLALFRDLLFTMSHHQEKSDVPTPLEYIERRSAPLAKFFEIILDEEPSADTEAAMRALPSRLLVEVLAPNDGYVAQCTPGVLARHFSLGDGSW